MIIKINYDNSNKDGYYYFGFAIVKKHKVQKQVKKDLVQRLKEYKEEFELITEVGITYDGIKYTPQVQIMATASDKAIQWLIKRLNDELVCDYINQVEVFLK